MINFGGYWLNEKLDRAFVSTSFTKISKGKKGPENSGFSSIKRAYEKFYCTKPILTFTFCYLSRIFWGVVKTG